MHSQNRAKQVTKFSLTGYEAYMKLTLLKRILLKFSIVAVHASPETRFTRLSNRRRSDDPNAWEVFHERDMRELSVGLGNVIAMAEQMIVNDTNVEDG